MLSVKWFYLLLISFLLGTSACTIESAHVPENRELIIASNYLTLSDTILFTSYEKTEKVEITLMCLTTEQILNRLNNMEASANIDLLLLNSLGDVNKFNKEGVLHPTDYSYMAPEALNSYASNQYNYLGFGIDPFILSYDKGGKNTIFTYNDLTRHPFQNCVEHGDLPILLAPTLEKLKKVDGNNWIKKFMAYSTDCGNCSDSLNLPVLSKYSYFVEQNSQQHDFIFPSRNTTGCFYDLRAACIVNQASNYSEAKFFVFHLTKEEVNIVWNEHMHTLSAFSTNTNFRKYQTRSSRLIPYYSMIERVLSKL